MDPGEIAHAGAVLDAWLKYNSRESTSCRYSRVLRNAYRRPPSQPLDPPAFTHTACLALRQALPPLLLLFLLGLLGNHFRLLDSLNLLLGRRLH